MASNAVEEYLQAIYTLADENGHVVSARLAEFLGFSAPAVSEMVHRLERDGLVSLDDHKEVHLTKAGKALADSVVRRHRLAECLFRDTFEIRSNEQIESNACVLEHVLSAEVTESICKFLKHPTQCPHGRPIPRGPCCEHSGQFRVVGAG